MFLLARVDEGLPRPSIYPSADGGVQLEWRTELVAVEVDILNSGTASAYAFDVVGNDDHELVLTEIDADALLNFATEHLNGDGDELEQLTDDDELLWRNAHPSWIETDGKISSQAFRPTSKDGGRLSTARSSNVTAAAHYDEHTCVRGLASSGVWAVSVGEAMALNLPSVYDEHSATIPQPAPKGHTSINFTGLSGGAARKAGGALRDLAEVRGKQHP